LTRDDVNWREPWIMVDKEEGATESGWHVEGASY